MTATSQKADPASATGGTQQTPAIEGVACQCNAGEMFEIYASLRALGQRTTDHCQSASAAASRQRVELEILTEWVRRLETNLREAKNHVEVLGTALDRIKIVALNTGLEGARLGDLAGKVLIAVSDELRTLTSRGLELLSEQASTIEQLEGDRQRLDAMTERVQANLNELDTSLRETLTAEGSSTQALTRFASSLQQATGLDIESAARLGEISEQTKGLVALLTELSNSERQQAMRVAVLPTLQPLLAWIGSVAGKVP